MNRSDFYYQLPPELIAQAPLPRRSDSRLLVLEQGACRDSQMRNFAGFLSAPDLLIFNDTRVIPARLRGRKETGGKLEILIERVQSDTQALAQLRASKSPRAGARLFIGAQPVEVLGREDDLFQLQLSSGSWMELLDAQGDIPLPPYIERRADSTDRERYQTLFARAKGAVAAPTAGLHFDTELLAAIQERGVSTACITLHVGAGTFQPVRVDDLATHKMHAERYRVTADLVEQVRHTQAAGGRVVAVGTTVVRALESAAVDGGLAPMAGESRLFITPGYKFQVVDALLTNFHLPESTLLMLVSAFAGHGPIMAAYRHAVAQRYRFFSYGDAMWLPTRADSAHNSAHAI